MAPAPGHDHRTDRRCCRGRAGGDRDGAARVSYLPSQARAEPPVIDVGDPPGRMCPELRDIVPTLLNRAYDVRDVIRVVTDRESFLEYSPRFARNLVTGLARIDGRTVVVMANQPSVMAGVLDVGAVIKAHKALTLCVELGLPLVSLVDVPGVLPTKEQEQRRIMTALYEHGVLRLRARVPKVAVVLRKGVGFGVMAMTAGDPEAITFVWPGAQICFTGVEACVRVVHPPSSTRQPIPRRAPATATALRRGLGAVDRRPPRSHRRCHRPCRDPRQGGQGAGHRPVEGEIGSKHGQWHRSPPPRAGRDRRVRAAALPSAVTADTEAASRRARRRWHVPGARQLDAQPARRRRR